MTTVEIVETIRKAGGLLVLDGDGIECQLPPDTTHLVPLLREHKPQLVELLRAQGGRVASFPHCPRCAGYALYRDDNIGAYECQSCGLQDIAEHISRRVQ
jgi:hypothetical protein